ncbi:mannitol dehydrogenase family protein [Aquitalea sp. LB_tupeE]|uniref:mannitol dehydrogenase family protein n=1 Tax=Aquitalea sp. LB_tupeE TaxID=2748078 RepID=UPI0015BDED32|nr:mannitol dehydrogenase family protein [Aquitalea sp. LB_tupeE]NWK76654.1 mannitol dehydrogenase family protein [Aquitalea sp. LB_tupeE]
MHQSISAASVLQAGYARQALRPRLLHLGCGAFHRAHQAVYADELARHHGSDWGYCEVSLSDSSGTIHALKQQDLLFSVSDMDAQGWHCRVVGIVCQALSQNEDELPAVLEALAHPDLAIVTLTITEKGYCHLPATGQLQLDHPVILHDAAHPLQPRSAAAVLLAGLRLRRQRGLPAFAVLSCDNMPANGVITRQVLMQLAVLQNDVGMAEWVAQHVACPSSMVDCIVPMVSEVTRTRIRALLGGVDDRVGVACEPFRQWVIEDHFPQGRPAWERVGVQLVADVSPFEEMKLRMLNGSHSFLAYLGYLAGYTHISDCMQDAALAQLVHHLMVHEQAVTLADTPQPAEEYAASLLQRFRNPALPHQTWQIAMDGSQKLPQRLLAPIRVHLARGSRFDCLALGLAAWMCYVSGIDEQGRVIDVRDPLAAEIRMLLHSRGPAMSSVQALLQLEQVFGADLPRHAHFIAVLSRYVCQLQKYGAKACAARVCAQLGYAGELAGAGDGAG